MERTLVVIKPDGVERNHIGKIIDYYEKNGLRVTRMEMRNLSKDFVSKHYPENKDWMINLGKKGEKAGEKVDDYYKYGKFVVETLRHYLSKGPVVAMIVEGENAISEVRRITGYTDPASADKGTIRGDLGEDSILKANREKRSVYNLVHASGNAAEAEAEIKLWFEK